MTKKRVMALLGMIVLVALIAIGAGRAAHTAATPAARVFSARALSIIGPLDSNARVQPQDLNCPAKFGWGLAQCGSQASSCKNCHEVKGEDSVNAKGDWHISHAFGDFCEFCHAGNVQAADKATAHQGMVQPLGDVKANCSSCHADDYQTRAAKYATVLGVTVGASGGQPPASSSGSSTAATPVPTPRPPDAAASAPKPAIVLPPKAEIVDYTQPANTVNMGNVIVALLLVITVVGGGAFVYWNEKRLRKAKVAAAVAATGTTAPAGGEEVITSIDQLPREVVKLLPTLQQLDPRTLRALRIILADRQRGEDLLQSLSLINFTVLEEMKRLDKKELSLLLALAGES